LICAHFFIVLTTTFRLSPYNSFLRYFGIHIIPNAVRNCVFRNQRDTFLRMSGEYEYEIVYEPMDLFTT
jgi:hypothetical protein